jgi:hypothetical protein
MGKALVATNIDSGEVARFTPLSHAARVLGLDTANIALHLRKPNKSKRVGRYAFRLDDAYVASHEDLPGEEWKTITAEMSLAHGFNSATLEGLLVSSSGRIENRQGRRTSGFDEVSPHGCYKKVTVTTRRVTKNIGVHTLICLAFHGPAPTSDHTVDHFDRNPSNNNATNLRWASRQQQSLNT